MRERQDNIRRRFWEEEVHEGKKGLPGLLDPLVLQGLCAGELRGLKREAAGQDAVRRVRVLFKTRSGGGRHCKRANELVPGAFLVKRVLLFFFALKNDASREWECAYSVYKDTACCGAPWQPSSTSCAPRLMALLWIPRRQRAASHF